MTQQEINKIVKALKQMGKDYAVITTKDLPNNTYINDKQQLVVGCPPTATKH